MSVNAVNGTDNRGRNAAIGAGVGLVGGGAAGYFTKSILKDGNFSDEFIHNTMLATADDQEKDGLKLAKKVAEMGEDVPVDKMKKVFNKAIEKFADISSADELEETKKIVAEGSDDEVKTLFGTFKAATETLYDETKKIVSDRLETIYDKAGKKFKELPQDAAEETKKWLEAFKELPQDAAEETKEWLEAAKKTARNMKLKPAAIYGAAAALVAGVAGYLATPKAKEASSADKANACCPSTT